jgi:hypothetical protein
VNEPLSYVTKKAPPLVEVKPRKVRDTIERPFRHTLTTFIRQHIPAAYWSRVKGSDTFEASSYEIPRKIIFIQVSKEAGGGETSYLNK